MVPFFSQRRHEVKEKEEWRGERGSEMSKCP
jgi:hypothetical protein